MARKRRVKKGSFGANLEEVVKQFPIDPRQLPPDPAKRDAASFLERRDIHSLLFERAWQLDQPKDGGHHSR